jgi:hypothetical protein
MFSVIFLIVGALFSIAPAYAQTPSGMAPQLPQSAGPQVGARAASDVPTAATPVAPTSAVQTATELPADIQNFLRDARVNLVDFNRFPQLRPTLERVRGLTESLLIAEDGAAPVRVLIVDDHTPNAMFLNLPPTTERFVFVNSGLLRFVESDDELAYVLGQELEHGVSDLRAARELAATNSTNSARSALLEIAQRRLEENEVDVKSVIRRLIRRGFNAMAGYTLLARMQRESPYDRESHSHPALGQRRQMLASALTGATRGAGEQIQTTRSRHEVTREAREVLRSPAYIEARRAELRQLVLHPDESGIARYLQSYVDSAPEVMQQHSYQVSQGVEQLMHSDLSRVRALAANFLPLEERLRLELEYTRNFYRSYRAQFERLFPANFAFSNATQAQLVGRLAAFRPIPNWAGSGGQDLTVRKLLTGVVKKEQELRTLEREIASNSDPATRERARSRLAIVRAELEYQRANFLVHRSLFPVSEAFAQQLRQAAEWFADAGAGRTIPDPILLFSDSALDQLATVGSDVVASREFGEQFADRLKNYLDNNFPPLDEGYLHFLKTRLDAAPAGEHPAILRRAIGRIEAAYQSQIAAVTETAERSQILHTTMQALGEIFQLDSKVLADLAPAATRVRDHFLGAATSVAELDALAPVERRWFSNRSRIGPLEGGERNWGVPGIYVPDAFHDEWFTSAYMRTYLDRRMSLLNTSTQNRRLSLQELSNQLTQHGVTLEYFALVQGETPLQADLEKFRRTAIQAIADRLPMRTTRAELERIAESNFMARFTQIARWTGDMSPARRAQVLTDLERLAQLPGMDVLNRTIFLGNIAHLDPTSPAESALRIGRLVTLDGRSRSVNTLDRQFATTGQDYIRGIYTARPDLMDITTESSYLARYGVDMEPLKQDAFQTLLHRWQDNPRELGRRLMLEFKRSFEHVYNGSAISNIVRPLSEALSHYTTANFLEFSEGYLNALHAYVDGEFNGMNAEGRARVPRAQIVRERRKYMLEDLNRIIEEMFPDSQAFARAQLDNTNPESIGRFLLQTLDLSPSWQRDQLFERLWRAEQAEPGKYAQYLNNRRLVRSLQSPTSRIQLAQWQLNHIFQLGSRSQNLRGGAGQAGNPTEVRRVVRDAMAVIEEQLPELTVERTRIVEHFESRIQTTQAESRLMAPLRLGAENWTDSRQVLLLNSPWELNSAIRSPFDRLEMLDYLSGQTTQLPRLIRDSRYFSERNTQILDRMRSEFQRSDVFTRTYFVQSFLDDQTGILSDPATLARFESRILGAHSSDPLWDTVFHTYLEAVPATERGPVLAYAYASLGRAGTAGRNSIRHILEGMGPLGIKLGQAMLSSGRLSPELQEELREFFHFALPPLRPMIYRDLERVFGANLAHTSGVREMVGSGSINYTVLTELRNASGQPTPALVRFRRDAAPGQIANEDENLRRLAARLRERGDPATSAFVQTLEEARLTAMETLGPDGNELNLGYERGRYADANAAYAGVDPSTGIRVRAARPLDEFQRLIPEDLQGKVSVYEFIPHENFSALPANVRQRVARTIVRSELTALASGTFDPDGHPGNWLYHSRTGELIRIDYSQLRSVSAEARMSFLDVVNRLFVPTIGNNADVQALATAWEHIVEFSPAQRLSREELEQTLRAAIRSRAFPSAANPQQRLFYLRGQVENAVRTRFGAAASVPFRADTRAMAASMGRLLNYRRDIGDRDFLRILGETIATPTQRITRKVLVERATDRVRSILDQGGAVCRNLWQSLIRRR